MYIHLDRSAMRRSDDPVGGFDTGLCHLGLLIFTRSLFPLFFVSCFFHALLLKGSILGMEEDLERDSGGVKDQGVLRTSYGS